MNSMTCGVLVTDNEKNLVLVNPVAPQMLDIESTSLIGRPTAEVLPQPKLVAMIDRVFGQEGRFTALEQDIEIGENTCLRARTAPVQDPQAGILGTVTVLQDITYLKEMDRMKSEFVTMVSHELKAPLAAIYQHMEVLLTGIAGSISDRQRHSLERAQFRAQGMTDLINELLDLSRIEAGQLFSQQEPLDMAPVIGRVVDLLRPQAEARHQTLVMKAPPSLPLISADPRNMDEMLVNLINNALKYTPERGRIEVTAERQGDYLQIKVTDTGIGIPKEDLNRIFDKFYRVKSDKTQTISGTGLGLPIVKAIVEAHHGSIRVDSRMARGASFTIILPLLATCSPVA